LVVSIFRPMWFVWTDGKWHPAKAGNFPPLEQNRAFSYGDGLFESMAVGKGHPLWLNRHLSRLYSGAHRIGLHMPVDSVELASKLELADHSFQPSKGEGAGSEKGAVWRLYAFRVSEGRYSPQKDTGCLMLRTETAPMPYPTLEPPRMHIGVAEQRKVPITLPEIKRMGALDYVLAAREARLKGWNDALMMNAQGRVAECSGSNIFLVKGTYLLTPALSEGCLPGVMRSLILEELSTGVGLIPIEQTISIEDCFDADAILLSNARTGIRDVGMLGTTAIPPMDWAKRLQDQLQNKTNHVLGFNTH